MVQLLNVADVARYLNVCKNTARKVMKEELPVAMIGGALKVDMASLEEWIEKQIIPRCAE